MISSSDLKYPNQLLYGSYQGPNQRCLGFFFREIAKYYGEIIDTAFEAEKSNLTYRMFKAKHTKVFQIIMDHMEPWWIGQEETIPSQDKIFETQDVPNFPDRWPWENPYSDMYECLPQEVLEKFAEFDEDRYSRTLIYLYEKDEERIVSQLKRLGYECFRDDDLLRKAYWY